MRIWGPQVEMNERAGAWSPWRVVKDLYPGPEKVWRRIKDSPFKVGLKIWSTVCDDGASELVPITMRFGYHTSCFKRVRGTLGLRTENAEAQSCRNLWPSNSDHDDDDDDDDDDDNVDMKNVYFGLIGYEDATM